MRFFSSRPQGRPRVRSLLGRALLLSIVIHAAAIPFARLKAAPIPAPAETPGIIRLTWIPRATPPPPSPTPKPIPTVARTAPPHAPVAIRATTSHARTRSILVRPVRLAQANAPHDPLAGATSAGPPGHGIDGNGAPPAADATSASVEPATAAPPVATPKLQCAKPHADAAIAGEPVSPEFSDLARAQGASGTTEVKVTIDASGAVDDASVARSSGFPSLDRAAVDAARATRYTPEIVDCAPTTGSYLFRADFSSE